MKHLSFNRGRQMKRKRRIADGRHGNKNTTVSTLTKIREAIGIDSEDSN